MAVQNMNRVVVTGNLTRDPELRSTSGGTSVCSLRIAVNGRKKNGAGEWVDDPNFFDVTVWGGQADACARYLAKGRPVGIDGRLDWQEWTDRASGEKRQRVQIVAESVQFLGGGRDGDSPSSEPAPRDDYGAADFRSAPAPAAPADDDIPF